MVAYSFKAQFAERIIDKTKCQSVRANRRRHARAGEPVQLYTGMRTRQCRKLLDNDPVCTDVRPILIEVKDLCRDDYPIIARIEIDGRKLSSDEVYEFAKADGFGGGFPNPDPMLQMAKFWRLNHGYGTFEGVVIKWEAS